MDATRMTEQVAGTRFAAGLRRQFEGLANGAAAARRPLIAGRPRWLVAAAVLATACIASVLLLVGLPALRDGRLTTPEPASAAEHMMAKLTSALATATTSSGDLEFESYRDYQGKTRRSQGRFVATAAGSLRLENADLAAAPGPGQGSVHATRTFVYDAARHLAVQLIGPAHGRASYHVTRNAPPEFVGYWGDSPFAYHASIQRLRVAIAKGDPHVTVQDAQVEGRPAWVAAWRTDVADVASGGELAWYTHEMTVDKETGLVLHYRIASKGAQDHGYDELTLSHVRVDAPVAPSAFALRPPRGAHRSSGDAGYRFGDLGQIGRDLGFTGVAPTEVPAGYALAEAATAPRDGSLRDALRPRSRPMTLAHADARRLELWYRRGFEAINIKIAPVLPSDGPVSQDDILARLERPTAGTIRVTTLTGGAVAGFTAYTWAGVEETGLLIASDAVTVWVAGDATSDELLSLANSLQPLGK